MARPMMPRELPPICPICWEALPLTQTGAHPECVEAVEVDEQRRRRTCFLCRFPIPDDVPDYAPHAACARSALTGGRRTDDTDDDAAGFDWPRWNRYGVDPWG